ncbi:hypothetical protein Pfo_023987 [Paulownia fortunei]|nr:hypothetical protein Pfo_023987 [Paulownia fortunei]
MTFGIEDSIYLISKLIVKPTNMTYFLNFSKLPFNIFRSGYTQHTLEHSSTFALPKKLNDESFLVFSPKVTKP